MSDLHNTYAQFEIRHPRRFFALQSFVYILFVLIFSLISQDPLTSKESRIFFGISALILSTLTIKFFWEKLGKKTSVILVGLLIIALLEMGIYALYAQKAVPGTGVDELMRDQQATAIKCLEKNSNLRAKWRGLRSGEPDATGPMCDQEAAWELLPGGWAYDPLEDADVSDGTFEFSARNRRGERIVCTQEGCAFKNQSSPGHQ